MNVRIALFRDAHGVLDCRFSLMRTVDGYDDELAIGHDYLSNWHGYAARE